MLKYEFFVKKYRQNERSSALCGLNVNKGSQSILPVVADAVVVEELADE